MHVHITRDKYLNRSHDKMVRWRTSVTFNSICSYIYGECARRPDAVTAGSA